MHVGGFVAVLGGVEVFYCVGEEAVPVSDCAGWVVGWVGVVLVLVLVGHAGHAVRLVTWVGCFVSVWGGRFVGLMRCSVSLSGVHFVSWMSSGWLNSIW